MFCSRCRQPIGTQAICPNCGAPTGVGALALPPSRLSRHLRTAGILWVVYAAYTALKWAIALPIIAAVFGGHTWWAGQSAWNFPHHPGFWTSPWFLEMITAIVIVRALLSLAVGIGLLTHQSWGRIFAIIIAILTLIKPITGTILGIYTLWTLLGPNSGQEYDREVAAAPAALR